MKSQTTSSRFSLQIDVEEWVNKESWDLEFDEVKTDTHFQSTGTLVRIEQLQDQVARRVATSVFVDDLIDRVQRTYSLFLRNDLEIEIAEKALVSSLPEIVSDDRIQPVRQTFKYDNVSILLIAGLTPLSDREPRGWYIFCNGRLILEANKDRRTGWGEDFPQFRPKFNHFAGFVYFNSEDPATLPWTTTKENIEIDSETYQYALQQMKTHTRPITAFLNNLYPNEQSEEEGPEKTALSSTMSSPLTDLKKSNCNFKFSAPAAPIGPRYASVQYRVEEDLVNLVKKALGDSKMSNKDMGLQTFQYYMEMECE